MLALVGPVFSGHVLVPCFDASSSSLLLQCPAKVQSPSPDLIGEFGETTIQLLVGRKLGPVDIEYCSEHSLSDQTICAPGLTISCQLTGNAAGRLQLHLTCPEGSCSSHQQYSTIRVPGSWKMIRRSTNTLSLKRNALRKVVFLLQKSVDR